MQIAVTIIKVALFCAIIVVGLSLGKTHAPAAPSLIRLTTAGFFAALVAALWAYDGWNNVSMVASEIRDPQRNLPLALIGGTLAVMAIYLFANWAYFHVLTAAAGGRQSTRRGRDDAPRSGRLGSECGFGGRHDQHFRGAQRLHSYRLASSLRRSARRALLPRSGLGAPPIPHSGYIHPGFEPVGIGADRAFRWLQGAIHVRDLRKLDPLWNGDGRSDCLTKKASGSYPTLSNVRLSVCTLAICFGGCFISDIDAGRFSEGIFEGPLYRCCGYTFLLLLEKQIQLGGLGTAAYSSWTLAPAYWRQR